MCIGCHGIPMYRTAFPEVYSVPMIAGQAPDYIVKSLQAYRAGDRSHPSMSVQAFAAGDADSGKLKSQACAACHGPDGNSPTGPDFPRLAGQHYDYLLKALRDYRSGARRNPIMGAQVGSLGSQDLADLAAFYSRQKGSLHVVR